MPATFAQANDEILSFFKTAWDTTGHPALYENVAGSPPTTQIPWARASLRFGPGENASLADPTGKQRFTRSGILTIQIFIPNGEGLSLGYTLSKIVADAFEGKATASHVWFRRVGTTPVGSSAEWYQFNVSIAFTYDEVK